MFPRQRYGDSDYNYKDSSSHPTRSKGRGRHNYHGYGSNEYIGPPRPERHKPETGEVLAELEIGDQPSEVGAITDRSGTRSGDYIPHHRFSGYASSHDGSRNHDYCSRWQQAGEAGFIAGVIEAFRIRKKPGPWIGEKGGRVVIAALSAAGIDGLIDKNPGKRAKRSISEAVIGGLALNWVANGSRH